MFYNVFYKSEKHVLTIAVAALFLMHQRTVRIF